MSALPPAPDRETVYRLLAEKSLAHFLRQAWETIEPAVPLEWEWYLDAICQHLEAVRAGTIKNLYIGVPPGCLKSIALNVAFVAWWWTTEPNIRFLCATNSESNGTRDSLACRNLIQSDWYQERWGEKFHLSGDQNVKTWYTNDKRGIRLNTTTGSKATGKKGDVQLLDDVHDVNDVESKVKREGVKYWHDKAFHNRVNSYKTARRVAIGQRTHYEDLYADFIARGWTCLILPEEFDPARRCTTSIGWTDPRTLEGEWLRESRFGPAQKAEAMKTLGRRGYATQHEQLPGPAEGNHFKREWFDRRYFDGGDFYRMPSGKVWFHKQVRRFVVVDPAGGKSAGADRTAIGVFGLTPENDLLILFMFCERIGVTEINPRLLSICNAWRSPTSAVEYVVYEAEFLYNQYAEDAQRTPGMPAVRRQSTEKKDKLTRALPAIIRAEAGQVLFPESGPSREWVEDCIEEMCLAENTEITTMRGGKPIQDVVPGDLVLTRQGWRRVTKARRTNGAASICEIVLNNGRSLKATLNHPILVPDCGFVPAGRVKVGDVLLRYIGEEPSIFIQRGKTATSTALLREKKYCFTAMFGSAKPAKTLAGGMSIMWTAIRKITHCLTCDAFRRASTSAFIGSRFGGRRLSPQRALFAEEVTRRLRVGVQGLVQSLVVTRTQPPEARSAFTKESAHCAKSHSYQRTQQASIAVANAPAELLEASASCLRRSVIGAEASSLPGQKPVSFAADVVVSAVHMLTEKEPVYNLEVEGCHEFVANGLLVHNCAFTGDDDPHDDRVDAIAWGAREAQEAGNDVGFEGVFAFGRNR